MNSGRTDDGLYKHGIKDTVLAMNFMHSTEHLLCEGNIEGLQVKEQEICLFAVLQLHTEPCAVAVSK
jgi:hypothetical protein